jgi:hypothetical protein
MSIWCKAGLTAVWIAAAIGCSDKPAVAPASGKVLYNGQPVPYGNVMFQPAKGQPAGAAIQPDGTFRLSTFSEFDGAIIGPHKVSVACYSSQRPSEKTKKAVGEATLGESLLPSRYAYFDQSGLTAEIPAEGTDSLQFDLSGPSKTFPE